MKKLSVIIALVLTLSLLLCPLASADVITALATEINPEHLEKTASYARILGYNEETNSLTVELIVPEVFDWEDVLNLNVGDSIYTGGQEVEIRSIEGKEDWCGVILINGEDVVLFEERDGYYRMADEDDDYFWNVLAVIECPVTDSLLFLDFIDENTGDMLSLPRVRTAEEFLDRLENSPVPFDANNVYVVFDGEGNLATINRYYVPWQ